jgi:hypothetical protein
MASPAYAVAGAEERASAASLVAIDRQLDELVTLLIGMAPHIYVARPAPGVSGSIGEHVRHALDHLAALLSADGVAALSYDSRKRGTDVETDVSAALRLILRLKATLEHWSTRSLDEPMLIESTLSVGGAPVVGWSTLLRELAFVFSHTVHHLSTISLLLHLQGLGVPTRLGYAPSTPPSR